MRLRIVGVVIFITAYLMMTAIVSSQQTKDDRREKIRFEYLKKFPLPKNNTQLHLIASFPDDDMIDKGCYLKSAHGVVVDRNQDIYVCDMADHKIMVFDSELNFLRQIGREGQGPSDFIRPCSVLLWKDYIIVNDLGNLRIQFLDKKGKYAKSFRTFKTYYQIEIDEQGTIYAAHFVRRGDPFLIDALSQDGKLLFSFGDILDFKSHSISLNDIRLSVSISGDIYVAYQAFPLIRQYSSKGELIKEIHLDYPRMKEIEELNLSALESMKRTGKQKAIKFAMFDLWVDGKNIFVVRYFPRFEIIQFDMNGNVKHVFWNNQFKRYLQFDFFVRKEKGKYVFYTARVLPDRQVDIFKY